MSYYRWEFNERLNNFKTLPVHDWSSHATDAWRYLALSLKVGTQKPKAIKYDLRGYDDPRSNMRAVEDLMRRVAELEPQVKELQEKRNARLRQTDRRD